MNYATKIVTRVLLLSGIATAAINYLHAAFLNLDVDNEITEKINQSETPQEVVKKVMKIIENRVKAIFINNDLIGAYDRGDDIAQLSNIREEDREKIYVILHTGFIRMYNFCVEHDCYNLFEDHINSYEAGVSEYITSPLMFGFIEKDTPYNEKWEHLSKDKELVGELLFGIFSDIQAYSVEENGKVLLEHQVGVHDFWEKLSIELRRNGILATSRKIKQRTVRDLFVGRDSLLCRSSIGLAVGVAAMIIIALQNLGAQHQN